MTRECKGMPRVMGGIVDGHRTGEADSVDEDRPEQDGEHSREKDSCGAGSGFGGSREHANHGNPNPYQSN